MVVGQVLFLFVVALVSVYCFRSVYRGRAPMVTIATISTAIYLFGMWIPAHLQNAGLIQSKLTTANMSLPPNSAEIDMLSVRWAVELSVLFIAEWLVWRTRTGVVKELSADLTDVGRRHEFIAMALVVVGVVATVVFPPGELEVRGGGGQGFAVLMRTFLIVGLAYLVYFRGFGRLIYWLIIVAGVALLLVGGVRSPLLVVACGFIASEIRLARFRKPRVAIGLVALLLVFASTGALMSNLRANEIRNYGLSTTAVIEQTLSNPWIAMYESGLDTLDGYRFSRQVSVLEPARPLDLLNVVTTFVPRAVWPEKPNDMSVDLSAKYLGYTASGQYLSPTGYLILVSGSYAGALAGLGIFAMLFALLIRRYSTTFYYSLLLCVIVRFMLGGSSFDLYYGLTLLVPILAIVALLRVHDHLGGKSTLQSPKILAVAEKWQTPLRQAGRESVHDQ